MSIVVTFIIVFLALYFIANFCSENFDEWLDMTGIYILSSIVFFSSALFLVDLNKKMEDILSGINTSIGLSIAVLVFYGYRKYSIELRKKYAYLNIIKNASGKNKAKDGAILIRLGGRSGITDDQKKYAKETLKIVDENIAIFNLDKTNIEKNDLAKLVEFLKNEAKQKLINCENIHLLYGAIGIGNYICGDILKNWKPITVYHNIGGEYKPWYTDVKHTKDASDQTPNNPKNTV